MKNKVVLIRAICSKNPSSNYFYEVHGQVTLEDCMAIKEALVDYDCQQADRLKKEGIPEAAVVGVTDIMAVCVLRGIYEGRPFVPARWEIVHSLVASVDSSSAQIMKKWCGCNNDVEKLVEDFEDQWGMKISRCICRIQDNYFLVDMSKCQP